jgi:antitoxin CcdA
MMIQGEKALDEAVEAAGGVAGLAARIGVHHSQIVRWRKSGRVPAARLAGVEAATGVPRHRLRPDLFTQGTVASSAAQPPAPLVAEAQSLGLDPAAIATKAIHDSIREVKARRWQEENRQAIAAWNRWTEENELPLARFRMF